MKRGFFFSFFLCGFFFLTGCFSSDFQSSYKETDIPLNIKKICQEEYKLKVIPVRVGNTLWVYLPVERLLHTEFGKNPDKIFDENFIEKVRNILTSISRVLLSSDKVPKFFVIVLSDIESGLDYSLAVNISDLQKSVAGGIPWNEVNKRYVIGLQQTKKAIGDTRGAHVKIYDITLPMFLSWQITQRAKMIFQEEPIKKYFILKNIGTGFQDKKFIFEYSLAQISQPKEKINIPQNILSTITYCFKAYEFKDFSQVVIKDLTKNQGATYESKDILAGPIE